MSQLKRGPAKFGFRLVAVVAIASLALALSAFSGSGSNHNNAADSDHSSSAQQSTTNYPTKTITFTVQAAPGGGSDAASRAIANVLEGILGVSIVVENRPGAAGSIAVNYVSEQPADGYHIGFCPVECAYFDIAGYNVSYNDVQFIAQIMSDIGSIAVPVDSPYQDLGDLIAAAKQGKVTVANAGAGSVWQVMTSALAKEAGVKFTLVPFNGSAPAVTAAMGGQVDAVAAGIAETHPGAESGRLRVLAVFSEQPSKLFPNVPTAKSLGYNLQFSGWGGIYGPKGMPKEVVHILEKAIQKAVHDPAYAKPMHNAGISTIYKDSADFTAFVKAQHDVFASILGD